MSPKNREEVRTRVTGHAERERAIAALGARQHRAAGDDQLLRLGLSRDGIRHRIRTGRMQRLHQGVVVIGPGPLHQRGRWWGALLACRPGPSLSNLSAAAEDGLAAEIGDVHIIVPRLTSQQLRGVSIHCSRHLDPRDLTRSEDNLPITALHRTLLDLAETLPSDRFEAIVEEADRRELLDFDAIRACMRRNPGRRGLKPLGRLLDIYVPVGGRRRTTHRFQPVPARGGLPAAGHRGARR